VAITWQLNGNRIDIVFSDPYTLAESEKVMREIFADARAKRPLRFLVDVRQSTPPDSEFVGNAITFWQAHISHMWNARIALVAATDAQARMGRLSGDTAESRALPFTVRVFPESDWGAATSWLDSPA
jgi:stage II sporulation SpoAA-like protein